MLAKVQPIEGAWQRLQSSRAFKKAEETCGIAALCVVGTFDRQPRNFGDNQGVHPSRLVVTTKDPKRAADNFNRGIHSVGALYHTQAHVFWPTAGHGEKAKTWIEHQVGGEKLLNNWIDLEPWQWEIMFNEAATAIGVPCFDATERARRIWNLARRGSV